MRTRGAAAQTSPNGERGYAMAALLVGLFIMGVMATVAMPVWTQAGRREKEAELVFRGEQYARAIGLYQRKMGPGTLPPNLDLLVDQKFLRRRFTDPITGKAFAPINAATAQAAGLANTPGGRGPAGTGPGGTGGGAGTAAGSGGIVGVVSASDAASLRLYNGRDHYNQWAFVYNPPTAVAGGAAGAVQGGTTGGAVQGGAAPRGARQPGSAPQRPVGPQGSGPSSPFGPSGGR